MWAQRLRNPPKVTQPGNGGSSDGPETTALHCLLSACAPQAFLGIRALQTEGLNGQEKTRINMPLPHGGETRQLSTRAYPNSFLKSAKM